VKKSDVFSFGLILYLLIVGRSPFPEGIGWFDAAKRIGVENERPDIPAFVRPDVGDLICHCWETDPEERPSFDAILTRLEDIDFRLWPEVNSAKVAGFVETIEDLEEADGEAPAQSPMISAALSRQAGSLRS
jgi:serine/threonine protein kinase